MEGDDELVTSIVIPKHRYEELLEKEGEVCNQSPSGNSDKITVQDISVVNTPTTTEQDGTQIPQCSGNHQGENESIKSDCSTEKNTLPLLYKKLSALGKNDILGVLHQVLIGNGETHFSDLAPLENKAPSKKRKKDKNPPPPGFPIRKKKLQWKDIWQ